MATPIGPVAPFFIVSDVVIASDFYRDSLGFVVTYIEPEIEPFFAIVERDLVRIMLKAVSNTVAALPNRTRHVWAPWDAFVYVEDPDALAKELVSKMNSFSPEVVRRDDGLVGFEVSDLDGYVLFFGRPSRDKEV